MKAVPLFACLLLLSALVRGAEAAPRVTLTADSLTLHEVLSRLRQETGWDLRGPSGEGTDWFEIGPNDARGRFNWAGVSLGKALREIGEAFHCVPTYTAPTTIQFEAIPKGAVPSRVRVSRDGVTFSVTGAALARTVDLTAVKPQAKPRYELSLGIRPADGDLDYFYGLDRVQAIDDQGRTLRWNQKQLLRTPAQPEGRIDEWQVRAAFDETDGRSRQFSRLEGELVLFRGLQNVREEIPVATVGFPLTRQAGSVELTVREIRAAPPAHVEVRYDAVWPNELEVSSTTHGNAGWPYPAVRLASGRLVRMGGHGTSSLPNGRRRVAMACGFEGAAGDAPVAVVWDLMIKNQPDRRIPFRLENIPLPVDSSASTTRPGKQHPLPGPEPVERLGSIECKVQIGETPAGEGELALGLSQKRTDGSWGPVRWKYVDTDSRGLAVLQDVLAGTYRVTRKFRQRDAGGELAPVAGSWLNGTAVIRVLPGRAVVLPPFKRR